MAQIDNLFELSSTFEEVDKTNNEKVKDILNSLKETLNQGFIIKFILVNQLFFPFSKNLIFLIY